MSQRPNNSSQTILYQRLLQGLWVKYCIEFEKLSCFRFSSREEYNYQYYKCQKLWQDFQQKNYILWHNCHNSWNFPKEKPFVPYKLWGSNQKRTVYVTDNEQLNSIRSFLGKNSVNTQPKNAVLERWDGFWKGLKN